MSKREQIIQAVKTRLSAIAAGGDYANDFAGRVHLRPLDDLENLEMPAVTIYPGEDRPGKLAARVREHVLNLTVSVVAYGPDRVSVCGSHLSDVLAAVSANKTWGALADGTDLIAVEEENIRLAKDYYALKVGLEIRYQTGLWEI